MVLVMVAAALPSAVVAEHKSASTGIGDHCLSRLEHVKPTGHQARDESHM